MARSQKFPLTPDLKQNAKYSGVDCGTPDPWPSHFYVFTGSLAQSVDELWPKLPQKPSIFAQLWSLSQYWFLQCDSHVTFMFGQALP